MGPILLHQGMQSLLAVEVHAAQDLPEIDQGGIDGLGLLPLVKVLEFMAFGG